MFVEKRESDEWRERMLERMKGIHPQWCWVLKNHNNGQCAIVMWPSSPTTTAAMQSVDTLCWIPPESGTDWLDGDDADADATKEEEEEGDADVDEDELGSTHSTTRSSWLVHIMP